MLRPYIRPERLLPWSEHGLSGKTTHIPTNEMQEIFLRAMGDFSRRNRNAIQATKWHAINEMEEMGEIYRKGGSP